MKKEIMQAFIRKTFFESTVDPFFQSGRTFQLKQPFRGIDRAIKELETCFKPKISDKKRG